MKKQLASLRLGNSLRVGSEERERLNLIARNRILTVEWMLAMKPRSAGLLIEQV
jgi:hypothetical protein